MKLSVYARQVDVSYRSVFRWFKGGKIQGREMEMGTILISQPIEESKAPAGPEKMAIYARFSAAENNNKLDAQTKGDPVRKAERILTELTNNSAAPASEKN